MSENLEILNFSSLITKTISKNSVLDNKKITEQSLLAKELKFDSIITKIIQNNSVIELEEV